MTTSSLCPTNAVICKVPQSPREVPIDRHIEYPVEHGEVINYALDGVSIHPVTTKIQVSFLTQLSEKKEAVQGFQHEANYNIVVTPQY
jgi:hypothetical protein